MASTLLLPSALNGLPRGINWEQLKSTLNLKAVTPSSVPTNASMLMSPPGAESSAFLSVEKTAGDSIWESIIHLNNQNLLPAKPLPPLIPRDHGPAPRCETILENEVISCFLVGGEKRLCFPQVLNTVLREFNLQDINAAVQKLNIHCSACTDPQLNNFKLSGVLPFSATSCGLITKSDAERLCSVLLRPSSVAPQAARPGVDNQSSNLSLALLSRCDSAAMIPVAHECFGRCQGGFHPELYLSAGAVCIECAECHELFSTDRFVMHSHRNQETRTCHWGFDSTNWRVYLHLRSDVEQDANLRQKLEEAKDRFRPKHEPNAAKRKSPAFAEPNLDSLSKRPRVDAASAFCQAPPAANVTGQNLVADPVLLWYYMLAASKLSYPPALAPFPNDVAAAALPFLTKKLLPPGYFANPSLAPLIQSEMFKAATKQFPKEEAVMDEKDIIREKEAELIQHLLKSTGIKAEPSLLPDLSSQSKCHQYAQETPKELNNQIQASVQKAPKKLLLQKADEDQRAQAQRCSAESDVCSPDNSSSSSVEEGHAKHDDDLTFDALLERYIWDPAALRVVRQRIAANQSLLEARVDSLSAENRLLHQEIAYLRRIVTNPGPNPRSVSIGNDLPLLRDSSVLQTALTEIQRAASVSTLRA